MKQFYLTLLAVGLFQAAQAQIDPPCGIAGAFLCDNFDAYTAGDAVGPGASWWTTWSGTEGGAEDGIVSDAYAYSGTNSMLIPGGGVADVVLKLGNQSTGTWRLEWMSYLPDGATGYYNIQESEVPGVAWNLEVLYGLYDYTTPAPSGEGVVMVPIEDNFSYPVATWFKVEHIFDLDGNEFQVYIDGNLILDYDYTGDIGGIDFYSIDANAEQYIDDVLLIEESLNTYYEDADADTYGNALESIEVAGAAPAGFVSDNTDCDDTNAAVNPGATEIANGIDDNCNDEVDEGVVGINELTAATMHIFPVPANDVLNINISDAGKAYTMYVSNAIGQRVYAASVDQVQNISIDVEAWPAGIYHVVLMDETHAVTAQVVIE